MLPHRGVTGSTEANMANRESKAHFRARVARITGVPYRDLLFVDHGAVPVVVRAHVAAACRGDIVVWRRPDGTFYRTRMVRC